MSRSSTDWKTLTARTTRAAAGWLEGGGLERDVARRAFELEGPDHAVDGRLAMEDAVEAELIAVGVAMDEAPAAAITELVVVEGHAVLAGAHPLGQELRVGVGAEEHLWRGVEAPGDLDLLQAGRRGDLCRTHRSIPFR